MTAGAFCRSFFAVHALLVALLTAGMKDSLLGLQFGIGKIFVMASSDMLKDNVLDASGRGSNATFILNTVDYLNGREDIAVMRAKVQRFNPVEDTQAGTKAFVKAFNIAGLPIAVIIFGLGVWFRRHSRKKHIQMMFDK